MFNVGIHAVLSLFALTVIKKQCNAVMDEEKPKEILVMDELNDFNMTYYCKFQANEYVCNNRSKSLKFVLNTYFYDIRHETCRQFEFGSCDHSYNLFDSKKKCLDKCRDDAYARISDNITANVYCRFQPDFGDCNSYQPSFYFDISTRMCRGFSYSGCGGNKNRFGSQIVCADICDSAIRHEPVFV